MHAVVSCSRLLLALNDTKVYNGDRFASCVESARQATQPLISVSNHTSTIDDPVVLSAVTPPALLKHKLYARWAWCAEEICFKNPFFAVFFRLGKITPIRRGVGLQQEGMAEALTYMTKGDWFHIFPEGKCIQEEPKQFKRLKWGVGKLIAEASAQPGVKTPIVLPFVHRGMPKIMPFYHYIPRIRKPLRVLVGEPLHFEDLIAAHRHALTGSTPPPPEHLYIAITERVHTAMQALNVELNAKWDEEGLS
jgi:monolysocardiolipin acyltransferase